MAELTMVEAINLALRQEMEADDRVVVLGEDVGVDGGVFRVTDGLIEKFGQERVIDTPLAEAAIVGASLGMALNGLRPVCELQFLGFSYHAMHQVESHVARFRWRSRGRFGVSMVARMPYGGGVHALEHHSESRETYYAHTPGLKVAIPSGPRTARSLLVSAIRDPDPVIFMEPKAAYRAFREEVPEEEETTPLGQTRRIREGEDVTVATYGAMVHRTLAAAEALADDGVECDVFDLQTVSPLDHEPVAESARSTGRVVVVHEAHRSFGPGAEIVARLVERSFWWLRAPIERVAGYDVIVPYFAREQAFLPDADRITNAVHRTLEA